MAWCSVTPSNNKPSLLFSKKKLRTLAASLCLLEVGFEEAVWPTFMMFLETAKNFPAGKFRSHILCVSLGMWLMDGKKPGLDITDTLKY